MSNEIILTILQLIILVGSALTGKYIVPKLSSKNINKTVEQINFIITYAEKFVCWAKQFMKESSGEEKMEQVVTKLKEVATKNNIDITEDEIKAIAQKAYMEMINSYSNEITNTEK